MRGAFDPDLLLSSGGRRDVVVVVAVVGGDGEDDGGGGSRGELASDAAAWPSWEEVVGIASDVDSESR